MTAQICDLHRKIQNVGKITNLINSCWKLYMQNKAVISGNKTVFILKQIIIMAREP